MINLLAFFLLVFGSYQPVHANDQPCADINGGVPMIFSDHPKLVMPRLSIRITKRADKALLYAGSRRIA